MALVPSVQKRTLNFSLRRSNGENIPYGMSNGHSASVYVDTAWVQIQLLEVGNGDGREGLIDFPQRHIILLDSGDLEQLWDGEGGSDREVDGGSGRVGESCS